MSSEALDLTLGCILHKMRQLSKKFLARPRSSHTPTSPHPTALNHICWPCWAVLLSSLQLETRWGRGGGRLGWSVERMCVCIDVCLHTINRYMSVHGYEALVMGNETKSDCRSVLSMLSGSRVNLTIKLYVGRVTLLMKTNSLLPLK